MGSGTQPIDLNALPDERCQSVDAFLKVPTDMLGMLLLILVVSEVWTRAVLTNPFLLSRLLLPRKE